MKKYFFDPVSIFMSLAVVFLLGYIGVALLCTWFAMQLSLNIEERTRNIES